MVAALAFFVCALPCKVCHLSPGELAFQVHYYHPDEVRVRCEDGEYDLLAKPNLEEFATVRFKPTIPHSLFTPRTLTIPHDAVRAAIFTPLLKPCLDCMLSTEIITLIAAFHDDDIARVWLYTKTSLYPLLRAVRKRLFLLPLHTPLTPFPFPSFLLQMQSTLKKQKLSLTPVDQDLILIIVEFLCLGRHWSDALFGRGHEKSNSIFFFSERCRKREKRYAPSWKPNFCELSRGFRHIGCDS